MVLMRLNNKKEIVQPGISIRGFEPILAVEQVAERLQLKPSTVYELSRRRSRHPLPVLRVGKFLRFRWSEIERWLNESREETA
jgi:excisionase family DNA binding protein